MLASLQSNSSLNCVSERKRIASTGGYDRRGWHRRWIRGGSGGRGRTQNTQQNLMEQSKNEDERGQGNVSIPT